MEKHKNQQRSRINKAFEKILRFDGTNPSYCFDWLERTEALVNDTDGSTEKSCCSTVGPVCPRRSMPCHKELPTRTLRMQYCGTTQISGPCRKDQTHIISCTRSLMKHRRHITQGTPHSLIWHTQS